MTTAKNRLQIIARRNTLLNTNLPYERDALRFMSMGYFQQALVVASKWVEAKEKDSFAWFCKSVCEMALERAAPALDSAQGALALDPGNTRYLAHRARCLIGVGNVMEGLEIARDLVQKENGNPQLLDALATTLAYAGETAEAVPVIEKAIALNSKVAQFHTNYASMLHFCGRTEESEAAHRKALELQPEDFHAYWLLSQLGNATPSHNHVDWFRGALATYKEQPLAGIGLNYALGKQLEDLGQYDEAFEHYSKGAASVLEQMPYKAGAIDARFGKYREEFDLDRFKQANNGHDNEEVILIIGLPRSGTTLVERIIASFDDVFAAGELPNFTRLFNERCQRLNPGQRGIDFFTGAASMDFEELGRAYIESTRPRTGHTKYFIDKFPFNFQLAGPFALALPNARIINLMRNPMDTCFSNFKYLFASGSAPYSYDQESVARYYSQYSKLMAHWHRCLPGQILDVEYERLIQNPEQGTQRITKFLGFDWDPACLDFHKSRDAVATGSAGQIREPINSAYLHRWKKFEAHLEPLKTALEHYGVDVTLDPLFGE
jgi:tetratricopeptide (TPR) repeat protein